MKIAVDVREAFGEKAGKGWYVFHLMKSVLKADNKNQYVLYSQNPLPAFENYENVSLNIIKSKGLFWHLKVLWDLRKQKADVFFAPTSYLIPAFLGKKIKSILSVHDLIAFLFPKTHNAKAVILEKLLLPRALKKADFVLCSSKNTKEDLLEMFPNFKNKEFRILYCGVHRGFKKKIYSAKERKGIFEEKFFLSVGTIIPRKNYGVLLEAFALVKETLKNHKLVIVGQKGWDHEKVFKIAEEKNLLQNLLFVDYAKQDSLVKYYNCAEIFVFPSLYEGFGIPPLEAMKCGCPVISSNLSSMKEVVNGAGLVVDTLSVNDLANAMIELAGDEVLRKKLINKGYKQAKKFSWEKSAQKFLNIIKEIEKA